MSLAANALAGAACQAGQRLFVGAAGLQAVIIERQCGAVLHLPLHATGFRHVGGVFKAAESKKGLWLDVIEQLLLHLRRGRHLMAEGIELVAQGYDQVFRHVGCNSQLYGDVGIQAVLDLAHFTGRQVQVVKRQQRDDAAQHRFAAVPPPPVISVVQAYPAKLGVAHRAFMKQGEVGVEEHPPGFEGALEQLATFMALQSVAAILAAALIQGREQAQNADVFVCYEARWLVEEIVKGLDAAEADAVLRSRALAHKQGAARIVGELQLIAHHAPAFVFGRVGLGWGLLQAAQPVLQFGGQGARVGLRVLTAGKALADAKKDSGAMLAVLPYRAIAVTAHMAPAARYVQLDVLPVVVVAAPLATGRYGWPMNAFQFGPAFLGIALTALQGSFAERLNPVRIGVHHFGGIVLHGLTAPSSPGPSPAFSACLVGSPSAAPPGARRRERSAGRP